MNTIETRLEEILASNSDPDVEMLVQALRRAIEEIQLSAGKTFRYIVLADIAKILTEGKE